MLNPNDFNRFKNAYLIQYFDSKSWIKFSPKKQYIHTPLGYKVHIAIPKDKDYKENLIKIIEILQEYNFYFKIDAVLDREQSGGRAFTIWEPHLQNAYWYEALKRVNDVLLSDNINRLPGKYSLDKTAKLISGFQYITYRNARGSSGKYIRGKFDKNWENAVDNPFSPLWINILNDMYQYNLQSYRDIANKIHKKSLDVFIRHPSFGRNHPNAKQSTKLFCSALLGMNEMGLSLHSGFLAQMGDEKDWSMLVYAATLYLDMIEHRDSWLKMKINPDMLERPLSNHYAAIKEIYPHIKQDSNKIKLLKCVLYLLLKEHNPKPDAEFLTLSALINNDAAHIEKKVTGLKIKKIAIELWKMILVFHYNKPHYTNENKARYSCSLEEGSTHFQAKFSARPSFGNWKKKNHNESKFLWIPLIGTLPVLFHAYAEIKKQKKKNNHVAAVINCNSVPDREEKPLTIPNQGGSLPERDTKTAPPDEDSESKRSESNAPTIFLGENKATLFQRDNNTRKKSDGIINFSKKIWVV